MIDMPKLPFAEKAMEPCISTETIQYHYAQSNKQTKCMLAPKKANIRTKCSYIEDFVLKQRYNLQVKPPNINKNLEKLLITLLNILNS